MAAWRYKISHLVLKKYFTSEHSERVKYFSTREEKFRISKRPYIYIYPFLFEDYQWHFSLISLYDWLIANKKCLWLVCPKFPSGRTFIGDYWYWKSLQSCSSKHNDQFLLFRFCNFSVLLVDILKQGKQ